MAYNRIVFNGNTLIDLTQNNDVVAGDVLSGKYFVGKDGEHEQGTMTNRGAVTGTIASTSQTYTIAAGYHNGNGGVSLSASEIAKIIPGNIKAGCTILSVQGNYTGETPTLQTITKSYTPSASAQSEEITAGTGYDYIQKVTVNVAAIPYEETSNAYGTTVTIG